MTKRGVRVRTLGRIPESVTYTRLRQKCDGFLSVYSISASDHAHPLDIGVRGDASVVLPIDHARREVYLIGELRPMIAFTSRLPGARGLHIMPDLRVVQPFTPTADSPKAPDGREIADFSRIVPSEHIYRYSCLAGGIDEGETPEAAAIRETLEETGLRVTTDRLTFEGMSYPSVGGSTERSFIFSASVSRDDLGEPVGDGAENGAGENIEVWRFTFEEAFAMCDAGEICATSSLLLLTKLRWREAQRVHAAAPPPTDKPKTRRAAAKKKGRKR